MVKQKERPLYLLLLSENHSTYKLYIVLRNLVNGTVSNI